jgi:hypothetical protein
MRRPSKTGGRSIAVNGPTSSARWGTAKVPHSATKPAAAALVGQRLKELGHWNRYEKELAKITEARDAYRPAGQSRTSVPRARALPWVIEVRRPSESQVKLETRCRLLEIEVGRLHFRCPCDGTIPPTLRLWSQSHLGTEPRHCGSGEQLTCQQKT